MSLYYCSITGEPAQVPVISKKTGHVYEKRIIEKFIDTTQTCPMTGQPLIKDDVIPLLVTNTIKPRPANATGVPELMTIFQGEWDNIMLETHGLKQNLENVRQELSHALYQHDAACRVIAKLVKERDEARNRITELMQDGMGGPEGMDLEAGNELPAEIVELIVQRQAELSNARRERRKNKELQAQFASQEALGKYKLDKSLTLHSSTKPGITCLDINPLHDQLLVTGGNDGSIIFYDKAKDRIAGSFEKHQKKITGLEFIHRNVAGVNHALCLSSSEDGVGYVLNNNLDNGEITVSYKVDTHKDPLVGCTVHPLSSVGIFCARNGSFSFHDLQQGRLLSYVTLDGYHARQLKVHPDGHIAVIAGHDGTFKVWNILENRQVIEIKGHEGAIDSLSFSENGVNFATGSHEDTTVKLWDLRNLGEGNFKLVDEHSGGAVSFDQSGQVLAVGTTALKLYNVKDLHEFHRFDNQKDVITSIRFGNYSKYIASVSLDRTLNIYS